MPLSYAALITQVERCAAALLQLEVPRAGRVAVYMEKRPETVVAVFGAAAAGAVFVPVNPLLKPEQVALHPARLQRHCPGHQRRAPGGPGAVVCGMSGSEGGSLRGRENALGTSGCAVVGWEEALSGARQGHAAPRDRRRHGGDPLHLGQHRASPRASCCRTGTWSPAQGAWRSISRIARSDRILAALPLSFDAGFSQLTTAFHVGASVALINYLMPRDVIDALSSA